MQVKRKLILTSGEIGVILDIIVFAVNLISIDYRRMIG